MPLFKVAVGLLNTLALAGLLGLLGILAPQYAAAALSQRVLTHGAPNHVTACFEASHACAGELVLSWDAHAPTAAVSSTPFESHPDLPLQSELPGTGMGSIETDDDLKDFDDFAYQLRVVFDGTTQLDREVERGASLGGRAFSRLEDNRGEKPPRG